MKQALHILPAIALAKAGLPNSVALAKAGLLTTAVFLISSAPSLFGQNFTAADNLALNTPPSKTTSTQSLAQYLCAEQPDDAHKARVLYAWVSLNITYVDSTDENEVWATPEHLKRQAPMKVLQNRTAVCQGFANLFCALMVEAGLPCEVVTGLAKKADGKIAKLGHAWAAARINGTWQLFDPTWGVPPVGISRWKVVDKYFMADPEHFVLKHLPDDPMWQLLENPVTERRFRDASDEEILEFVDVGNKGEFKFRDTLDHWIAMDSASRMFGAESRVLRFNGSNERVVFGLGQRYWGLFFDLQYALDSLTYLAIMYDTTQIDTIRFQKQLSLMERYHKRASLLFERLKTAERVQKTEKFYAPNDVAALLEKIQGDMRAGVFEYLNHGLEGVLTQSQLAKLRYQFNLASQFYHRAESKMNCDKMARNCFDVRHNRSLMAIQLGQQQVRLVQ
ncbi:MAG: hypothetical protein H7246_14020, partial [Phycisphaerae bacterium]|nr:hypothetical protein [Saprospiraceae bacterium]